MLKLRTNHARRDRSGFGSLGIRLVIFVLLMGVAFVFIYRNLTKAMSNQDSVEVQHVEDRFFLPTAASGEIVHHKYYSLSYVEKHEQAEWVAYQLTKSSLLAPNVKRAEKFRPDYDVKTGSAFHRDYSNSGYTRGHMAPAGDMAFNKEAMNESFYMSNMSPQLKECNAGIWRELEELVRDWAFDRNELIVVAGPMLNRPIVKKIGRNKVSVPTAFYKIILDPSQNESTSFIIPNENTNRPLKDFAVSIDQIEDETGIDFFNDLLNDDVEEAMESKTMTGKWRFHGRRR